MFEWAGPKMKFLQEFSGSKPTEVSSPKRFLSRLSRLRTYGQTSYASLTREDGAFLQVGGGGNTCVIEYHDPGRSVHLRARKHTATVPFTGPQTIKFGGGELIVAPEQLFQIADVLEVFEEFLASNSVSEEYLWEPLEFLQSQP